MSPLLAAQAAVVADGLSSSPLPEIAVALAAVVALILLAVFFTVRHIPNQEVGVVEKLWSSRGSVP
jgi:uncharacterized membrane protein YqiK